MIKIIDLEEEDIIIKYKDQRFGIRVPEYISSIMISPIGGNAIHYRGFRPTSKKFEHHIMRRLTISVVNDMVLERIWEESNND